MACVRSLAPSFSITPATWALAVCVEMPSSLPISAFVNPSRMKATTSISRGVSEMPATCRVGRESTIACLYLEEAMAVREQVPVQSIAYGPLRERLLRLDQRLDIPARSSPG
jgi:hypothetical protein